MQNSIIKKRFDLFTGIFFIYILINPLLDLISGVFLDKLKIQFPITPSLVIRMAFLVLMLLFLLLAKDVVKIRYLTLLFVLWVANVAGQYLFAASHDYFVEVQYFARFIYNLVIIFAYEKFFDFSEEQRTKWRRLLMNCLLFVALVSSLSIVLLFFMKFGLTTYRDLSGNKGYFHAGNDITAVLISLLPISIYCFITRYEDMKLYERILRYAAPVLTADALLLIGTKSSYIAIIFNVVAILGYILIKGSRKDKRSMYILLGLIVCSFAVLLTLGPAKGFLENSWDRQVEIAGEKENLVGFALSDRNIKAANTFDNYKAGNIYTKVFGLGRGSQPVTIEMDVLEVFMYYGILGFIFLLYPYVKRGFGFTLYSFRNMDLENFCLLCSIGLTAAYAFLAGHVLFSAQSGIYLSLVLAYSRKKMQLPADT